MSEAKPGAAVSTFTVIGTQGTAGAAQVVSAATPFPVGGVSVSKGNKRLTLAGSSALLSSVSGGIPSGATKCIIRPAVAININDDGTAATSSDYPIAANTEWVYDGDQLAAVRMIGTGDVDLWFYA